MKHWKMIILLAWTSLNDLTSWAVWQVYQLSKNDFGTDFRHHVHGGVDSVDRQVWETEAKEGEVTFSLFSPDGSEVGCE